LSLGGADYEYGRTLVYSLTRADQEGNFPNFAAVFVTYIVELLRRDRLHLPLWRLTHFSKMEPLIPETSRAKRFLNFGLQKIVVSLFIIETRTDRV
jgi:hypothetical protein